MSVNAVQSSTGTSSAPPPSEVHRVAPGETLTSIARDHGVSVQALERANPQILHPDLIRPGQAVHIPEEGAPHASPSTSQADYTVRPGDTLSGIAHDNGVNWRVMAAVNGVGDPRALQPGTVLYIPRESAHAGAVAGSRTATPATRPQAAPEPARSSAAQATAGGGLPRTEGLSPTQKYDVYANYVNTYGDAHARADLAAGRQVILGLRQDTNTHANGGGGIYDDRMVVLGGGKAQEFTANTDPSARYEGRDGVDADGDGRLDLGRLAEGSARFTRSSNPHLGSVLRATGTVGVERDTNHDGAFTSADRNGRGTSSDGSFLIHAGGNGITGSAGCQTMKPADFRQFWGGLSAGQSQFSYVLVDTGRHAVGGAAAAAPPAPAATSRSASSSTADLGSLSARFESNGRPGTVSSGNGDRGGVSYGAYQTTTGNVGGFVAREGAPWAADFAGKAPGTTAFSDAWRAAAARDPKAFLDAQHAYIARSHYGVQTEQVQGATGLDVSSHSQALRDVVWSTAVQHGPQSTIVQGAVARVEAGGTKPGDASFDRQVINAIYDERGRTEPNGVLTHFSGNSASVQQGVAARFVSERRAALAELSAGG